MIVKQIGRQFVVGIPDHEKPLRIPPGFPEVKSIRYEFHNTESAKAWIHFVDASLRVFAVEPGNGDFDSNFWEVNFEMMQSETFLSKLEPLR